ncbi:MAG: mevalonate kinase [Sandaracinaceae bacterium]|nr:mevalonate kinase [Sandaracinaceae bacterium]
MSFAHGKVILLGEHAVVYGHPAIAGSIERGVSATAQPAERASLSISPWNKEIFADESAAAEPLARAFARLLQTYDTTPLFRVSAEVGIPAGGGLGCSAALGVAVVRALDEARKQTRSTEDVIAASLEWEKVFHGNPSGIDSALAATRGLCLFRRGAPLENVRARKPLYLVIGNSGEPSSTAAMVSEVARQLARDKSRVEKIFDAISALVTNGRMSIEHGDHKDLGKLMDLNHALLNALMLSTSRLEEMCAAARHAGALGAKLTGAGGGGCMIALVEDSEIAVRVEGELRALSCEAFSVQTYAP